MAKDDSRLYVIRFGILTLYFNFSFHLSCYTHGVYDTDKDYQPCTNNNFCLLANHYFNIIYYSGLIRFCSQFFNQVEHLNFMMNQYKLLLQDIHTLECCYFSLSVLFTRTKQSIIFMQ